MGLSSSIWNARRAIHRRNRQPAGVIDAEISSGSVFEGGAYDFTRWHIVIAGDRAMVAVRCRIFLEMAQNFEGPRHRAENIVDYELTLERVDRTWLVASETNRFAQVEGRERVAPILAHPCLVYFPGSSTRTTVS